MFGVEDKVWYRQVVHLCLALCNPMDCSPLEPLSMESSKQEYWSGQPFTSPEDLLNPGIEPGSSALQAGSLLSEPPGKPQSLVDVSTKRPGKQEVQAVLLGDPEQVSSRLWVYVSLSVNSEAKTKKTNEDIPAFK